MKIPPAGDGPGAEPGVLLVTDLDGTLLDHHTYRPGPAVAAYRRLVSAGVGIAFCSAKTLGEQKELAARLGGKPALVVENGAAVILPPGFAGVTRARRTVLGRPYREVRAALLAAAEECGTPVTGYGDMSIEAMMDRTGLDRTAAVRARTRCYTETFLAPEDPAATARLEEALHRRGMGLVHGARFLTAVAGHDKGTGVRALLRMLDGDGRRPLTFGIGDALNDAPMLAEVDHPMLVQRPDGRWAEIDDVERLDGIGPHGWCLAAERILQRHRVRE